ncbi:MAG: hypothetical protein HKN14_00405 [Marinicaulis sp.]|nr:hypothetical protein [Marinicaulis sp.]NNE39358.1 hypothetical protein [Marinicaulis sp.]NNL89340.1 hypothetical protein [Marinicaulis sp.]
MTRNWGLPTSEDKAALNAARLDRPVLTLTVSAVFGVLGASIAILSFAGARELLANLFHGGSLVVAVLAAGFGCWSYIWLARRRFAAHFTGEGHAFSSLLVFYIRAAASLIALLLAGLLLDNYIPAWTSVLFLCAAGGAGAAAAFQTVLTFVPYYE